MSSAKYIIKLCLLGDGAVGKTSLVRRFVFDVFDDKYLMSFGTKVSKKSMKIGDTDVDLMIWDILGQKIHESLHAAYYRGSAGAFAVCDFTRPETMRSLKSWLGNFRATVGDKPVVILGNKSDLQKAYALSELQSFGSEIGCEVFETSAKTGLNVENAFLQLGKKLLEDAK
jgi:small GTP-binding protein